jgi:hypothetical protein
LPRRRGENLVVLAEEPDRTQFRSRAELSRRADQARIGATAIGLLDATRKAQESFHIGWVERAERQCVPSAHAFAGDDNLRGIDARQLLDVVEHLADVARRIKTDPGDVAAMRPLIAPGTGITTHHRHRYRIAARKEIVGNEVVAHARRVRRNRR